MRGGSPPYQARRSRPTAALVKDWYDVKLHQAVTSMY